MRSSRLLTSIASKDVVSMNFDYSVDQKLLKEQARKFLTNTCPPTVVRGILDGAQPYDGNLWKSIAELGWLGTAIPEEYGGLGLGYIELCALAEELGRAIAPTPFSSTIYLFAEALLLAGSVEQKQRLLPAVASGELIGCLAIAEGPGDEPLAANVVAGRLNGRKLPVTDGDVASYAVVLAGTEAEAGLFLIDLNVPGVTRECLRTLDPSRSAAALTFQDVAADPLGQGEDGALLLQALYDRAAVLLAFEQIGGADRALEMARDYALERHAFGRQIGSYQAIKHRLADMYIRNEVARSNAYYGAWALAGSATQLGHAAAAARVAACEAYWYSSKEAIEVFGGIGTTWEADCHLHYRRAKQLALLIGGAALWRERLICALESDQSNSELEIQ